MTFEDISYNFGVAKVLSILMVASGHYFGGIFWIPATFGLFIFAFSSGFFTSEKYGHSFSTKNFWYAKIGRLLYSIFVIDIFLLLVFLVQQRTGILTWQTLPSLVGLNGFLTWFKSKNPSPFGAGLWFFTLLLMFYFFYPLLSMVNRKQPFGVALLLTSLIAAAILQYTVPMGHMLWLTVFAFIFGNYSGTYRPNLSTVFLRTSLIVLCLLIVFLNTVLNYNSMNYFLILISSIFIVVYLLNRRLPGLVLKKVLSLSGCTIQIYFIHTYLFMKTITKQPVMNYAISMLIIITVALCLSRITEKLRSMFTTKIQPIGLVRG